MTEEKNPYTEMPEDILMKNLEQLSVVVKEKGISTTQFFGEPITAEQKAMVEEHASLTKEVQTLKDAATASNNPMSDDTKKLVEYNVSSAVEAVKAIDPDLPIDSILASVSNPFERVEVANGMKGIAEYSKKAVDAIKSQLPGTKAITQGFSAGEAKGDESTEKLAQLVNTSGFLEDKK